jgi:hypothetical protein
MKLTGTGRSLSQKPFPLAVGDAYPCTVQRFNLTLQGYFPAPYLPVTDAQLPRMFQPVPAYEDYAQAAL